MINMWSSIFAVFVNLCSRLDVSGISGLCEMKGSILNQDDRKVFSSIIIS